MEYLVNLWNTRLVDILSLLCLGWRSYIDTAHSLHVHLHSLYQAIGFVVRRNHSKEIGTSCTATWQIVRVWANLNMLGDIWHCAEDGYDGASDDHLGSLPRAYEE